MARKYSKKTYSKKTYNKRYSKSANSSRTKRRKSRKYSKRSKRSAPQVIKLVIEQVATPQSPSEALQIEKQTKIAKF